MEYKGETLVEHKGRWYFEDPALAETHHGEHNEESLRTAWMTKAGAVECTVQFCLGKILYGRQHACGCAYGSRRGKGPLCDVSWAKRHEWFDHCATFWIPGRKEYVVTAQPYDVSLARFRETEAFAEENGLQVTLSLDAAWWYPGRTPLIVWRKRGNECHTDEK